ncbi:formate dehydrogenase accessory sulfurtransferase FdhD [Microlunatus panaciterrae]|uniref:Sulfur carrier protein FdhD n=1 Tax=Microlunatus panaciterrae TaxID=400768 RepID=A0ABS2RNI0_9ACTN|nr:formate dehydrogenase accessory sulfurtransferase FdhD [Microlunatus panaciterrae]MBM7800273.1 FdhD protein [Microlunatus panaciterrae]
MGRVTRKHSVLRTGSDGSRRIVDLLAVEEPLEVRLNGTSFSVTMRTPGDDIDLIHGLLHAEGVIAEVADIAGARYCDGAGPDGMNTYNVLDVALAPGVAPPEPGLQRNVLTSSACGVCGTTSIDQVVRDSRHDLDARVTFDQPLVAAAPDLLRERQKTFAKTGGLHAAGLLTAAGEMLCVREDVGRHNAVDKVIGWAVREGRLPLSQVLLAVSGRASFELTQKAVLAGIPMLVAVSAPSSLAVELADQAGLTLVGFVRGSSMNVYTHPGRVAGSGDPG